MNRDPASDARFQAQLRREVEAWEQDGTITPQQAQAILARYPAAASLGAVRRRHSLVIGVSILGAVLVGLGVIAFFAANWNEIPRAVKLGSLVAGVALSYGAGYLLWQRLGYIAVGVALVLLGCIIYGVGVHLIGQIYHIPVDHPDLMAFWFLGVLPLAYATRSRPITALAIVLFLAAVGFRLAYWNEFRGSLEGTAYIAVYVALGLAIYAIGRAKAQFAEWRQMGDVFRFIGLAVAFGALYLLTFHDLHQEGGGVANSAYAYWILAGAAALVATTLPVGVVWRTYRGALPPPAEFIEIGAAAILLAASLAMILVTADGEDAFAIVFNVLFALSALGLMVSGYQKESEGQVNLSLLLISIYLISRYFEYAIDLLSGSLVFVGAGVILLVGGFLLERGRRRMLEAMRANEGQR